MPDFPQHMRNNTKENKSEYLDGLVERIAEDEEKLTPHQLQYRLYTIGTMYYRMHHGIGFPVDMQRPGLKEPSIAF